MKNIEELQNQLNTKEKEWYNEKRLIIEQYNNKLKILEIKYNTKLNEPQVYNFNILESIKRCRNKTK